MTSNYEKESKKEEKELLKKTSKKCVSIYDFFEIYKLYEEDDD